MRGLMLDVTEQKMFQAQLQRERDFNQKILNTTQSMILVLDTAGLISYANRRCYEAGYREEEMDRSEIGFTRFRHFKCASRINPTCGVTPVPREAQKQTN
jgi:PAS domain-containing protein